MPGVSGGRRDLCVFMTEVGGVLLGLGSGAVDSVGPRPAAGACREQEEERGRGAGLFRGLGLAEADPITLQGGGRAVSTSKAKCHPKEQEEVQGREKWGS